MKKKTMLRCLIGAPVGVTVSLMITIAISLTVGDGQFYAVVPELIADCGNEVNAVLLQTLCSLLYGAAWAGASVIRDTDWSLLRQTVTHLIVCSVCTFPIAYFMRWMEHSAAGMLGYFGMFAGIYAVIWIAQYTATKRRIREINMKMKSGSYAAK